MQDYKCPHAVVMISATLVNAQAHRQLLTGSTTSSAKNEQVVNYDMADCTHTLCQRRRRPSQRVETPTEMCTSQFVFSSSTAS